jgi:hypothetical protein
MTPLLQTSRAALTQCSFNLAPTNPSPTVVGIRFEGNTAEDEADSLFLTALVATLCGASATTTANWLPASIWLPIVQSGRGHAGRTGVIKGKLSAPATAPNQIKCRVAAAALRQIKQHTDANVSRNRLLSEASSKPEESERLVA